MEALYFSKRYFPKRNLLKFTFPKLFSRRAKNSKENNSIRFAFKVGFSLEQKNIFFSSLVMAIGNKLVKFEVKKKIFRTGYDKPFSRVLPSLLYATDITRIWLKKHTILRGYLVQSGKTGRIWHNRSQKSEAFRFISLPRFLGK